MRTILLLGTAREQSTRVPNKMLRQFGDTTLFDLYLRRLEVLQALNIFSGTGIAVSIGERQLYDRARDSSVPIIPRNARSIEKGIQRRSDELHFLAGRDEEYVCFVNACLPFFPVEVIAQAVELFQGNEGIVSIVPVRAAHNWYWTTNSVPINNCDPNCLSTQGCPPLYETVHGFFIYPRERMLRDSLRWRFGPGDPFLFDIGHLGLHLLDVDNETDFSLCEMVYRARLGDTKCHAR